MKHRCKPYHIDEHEYAVQKHMYPVDTTMTSLFGIPVTKREKESVYDFTIVGQQYSNFEYTKGSAVHRVNTVGYFNSCISYYLNNPGLPLEVLYDDEKLGEILDYHISHTDRGQWGLNEFLDSNGDKCVKVYNDIQRYTVGIVPFFRNPNKDIDNIVYKGVKEQSELRLLTKWWMYHGFVVGLSTVRHERLNSVAECRYCPEYKYSKLILDKIREVLKQFPKGRLYENQIQCLIGDVL